MSDEEPDGPEFKPAVRMLIQMAMYMGYYSAVAFWGSAIITKSGASDAIPLMGVVWLGPLGVMVLLSVLAVLLNAFTDAFNISFEVHDPTFLYGMSIHYVSAIFMMPYGLGVWFATSIFGEESEWMPLIFGWGAVLALGALSVP